MNTVSTNEKMIRLLIGLGLIFLASITLFGQQRNEHHVYNLNSDVHVNTLDITPTNGFVTAGWYLPNLINGISTSTSRMVLVQLNSAKGVMSAWHFIENNEIANNSYNVEMKAYDVKAITGGDFIVAGRIINNNVQPYTTRAFLMRLNPSGTVLWFKEYFDGGLLNSIVETTSANGFVACGYTTLANGEERSRLLRVDGSGNVIWYKSVAGTVANSGSAFREVAVYSTNKYAVVGNCNTVLTSCGIEKSDILLTIADESSSTPSFIHYSLGRTNYINIVQQDFHAAEFGNTLAVDAQGLIVIGGHTIYTEKSNCSNVYQDASLMKVTAIPTCTFSFCYEYPIQNDDLSQDVVINGNEIALTGTSDNDAFLLRTDLNGNVNGLELFNNSNPTQARALEKNPAGDYVWIGGAHGFTTTYDDFYLVERNPIKDTDCNDWDDTTIPFPFTYSIGTPDESNETTQPISQTVHSFTIAHQDSILCQSSCLTPVAENDTLIVCKDSTFCLQVFQNDTYGFLQSSSIITNPTNGTIISFNPATGYLCYNPSVAIGTDLIEYEITDDCGTDTASVIIIIEQLPTADYTVSGSGLTLSFTDASTGNIDSWSWDFDDGTTSSLQNPTHTFPGPGVYMVCLTVENECGTNTYCAPQIDCAPPICNNDYFDICDNLMTLNVGTNDNFVAPDTFTVLIPPALGSILFWNATTGEFTYSGPSTGSYTDSLKYLLCDPFGCCEAWAYINVNESPSADFTFSTNNLTVFFNNTSTGDPFTCFEWDFGDGTTDTLHWNPVHTYSADGGYAVCLTVKNECGEDTFCDQFYVEQCVPTVANFDNIIMCQGDTITVDLSVNDSWSGTPVFTIDIPPSAGTATINSATGVASYIPNANFHGSDEFWYGLDNGCGVDTAHVKITVNPLPIATFTYSISGNTVTVTSTAQYANSIIYNFGDGVGTFNPNHSRIYTIPGTYELSHIAYNNCGTDTVSYTIIIVPTCPAPVCQNDTIETCEPGAIIGFNVILNDSYTLFNHINILTNPVHGTIQNLDHFTGDIIYEVGNLLPVCDSFEYVLHDHCGGLDSAWVYIKCPITGTLPNLTTCLTVILEGPYNPTNDLMGGNLNSLGEVPTMEPYADLNTVSYLQATTDNILENYGATGPEDWVCVHLRDANNPNLIIATKSGLLTREGKILSGNGADMTWYGVPEGSYYVAVFHRNHLPICSATPIFLDDSGINMVDFSDGSSPIYGGGGIQIDGKWMMIAGDVNGDGQTNVVDIIAWRIQNGQATGYENYEDMNGDGACNAADNAIWTQRNSQQAQLPFTQ